MLLYMVCLLCIFAIDLKFNVYVIDLVIVGKSVCMLYCMGNTRNKLCQTGINRLGPSTRSRLANELPTNRNRGNTDKVS